MSDIYQFLELRRVEKGAEMSHTSMSKPKGSFMIKKNEMAKFFELYDKALQKGDDLCLIERHIDYGPMVIDLDFEYLPDVDERQHDEEHIRGVVKLYQEEVVNMFNLEPDDSKLTAYVFQKPAPYREKEKNSGDDGNGSTTGGNKYKRTKDGIHIIFPFIVSTPEPQYLIRENILKRIGTVLDALPLVVPKGKEGNNSYTAVVDRSVIQANGWFLFGSTKPGHEKYELNYIYKHDMTCIDFDNVQDIPQDELASYFNNMTPTRFFSIRNKNEIDIVPVRDENMDAISRFRAAEHKKATKKKNMNEKMNPEETNLIKQFVQIMSDKRANEYNSWIEVGWALHNMGAENQDLLDIWIEFSKRSSKYVDGDCETRWESMKDEGLGIGSIRYWARLDNPDMYKKIIMNDINKMIEASIKTPTNFDIASVLHRMFRYDYKYSKDEGWYYFDNHLWRRNEDGMMLRSKISTDLCEKYAYMIRDNNKRMLEDNEMTDEEKEDIKARNKEILGIIAKLKTTSFKENIMKECKEIFYDIDFINKLDENFYLIGFTNGIYDLKRGELREGRPDDYVTLTTRIPKIDFSEDHEQWGELSKFIYTIFPDEEKREYFMTFLATCLQGLNAEEKFRVWTGSGCHAKDTRIMMSNGQWKMVQDIQVGDQLMGDDSTVRNVLELKGGFSDMYKIKPIKGNEFIVNGDHILCLKATTIGSLTNSVKEHRYKLIYQIRDENGLPVNKGMNFAYKSTERKQYKNGVIYYETEEDAYNAGMKYWNDMKETPEYIHKNDVIEVKVSDYIKYQKSVFGRNYFIYTTGITFADKEVPFDPYIIGYWLGDGTSKQSSITTIDPEVVEYFNEMARVNNLNIKVYDKENTDAKTYAYSSKAKSWNNKNYDNKFYQTLKNYEMLDNKHIPDVFKMNGFDKRLQLLAGIIDSDGHYQKNSNQYEITLVNEKLIDDIVYVSKSLGFACTKREVQKSCNGKVGTYYNIIIYGEGIENIPVKLERKKSHERTKNKDSSYYGFSVERVEDDHYYGFQLDGNHRYVMDGFFVTHNSNGKSKLEELFTAAFGEYTIKFPITLLTGKRAASNACSPELVKAKGKRIGYFVEPSEGERVNAGLMKEFTGGDKIYARGLNKDPIEFKPQFKLSLLCNDVPHFPPKDTGVWRRVEIVEFSSKFVEKPNPEDPNQFPIDNKITEKIQLWKELFMAYLIDVYYAKYKVEGIKVPESVLRFTIEFQKMFDMYSEFIDNVIVETGIETDVTTLSELHEEFKNWYLETFNNPKIPTKHEFRQYMEKTYGKKRVTSSEIKGIKSKMKIEEEKKKKEAEERAKLGIVDEDDDMREVMDDEDLEALGVVPLTPEELARLEEEEMDFGEDELFDNEEFNKKYRNPDGTLKTPPKLKSISSCNMNGPPMIRTNNGSGDNTHVTTRNNEYNITSLDQLKSLNIPGMENIDDNPVLKAIFSRDMNQIRNLQYLEMKQTGPNTYALPETTLPPVKTVETFEDENGNRTTTTTITNTRNIPVVKFEGLPPGFKGNPFALIAAKRPPPPPPHHIVAAMMASMLARREMEEEERERRRKNGEPEPPMPQEDDMDLPPDHPMLLAFAAMMKNVIEHDIEEKVRNDPTVPPDQVQDRVERIMKHIFEDDDEEEFEQMMRQREMEMKKIEEEKKVVVEEKKEDEDEVKIEEVEQVVQEKKSVKRGRKPKNQTE
jgi:P4 family phage/plasmid primase-like protien